MMNKNSRVRNEYYILKSLNLSYIRQPIFLNFIDDKDNLNNDN